MIRLLQPTDAPAWDSYVLAHPHATPYHLSGWKSVIEKSYNHKTYYLMAIGCNKERASHARPLRVINKEDRLGGSVDAVVGVLPLVHLKHILFGNSLISIPFFDEAGILADNPETEKALLNHAIKLGCALRVKKIELRQIERLACLDQPTNEWSPLIRSHKLRMLLKLPDSSEILMESFKSKLRSQIKRPMKEGLRPIIGGLELLKDFYEVFSINMRDLGSPVHSRRLMKNVLEEFPDKSKIIVVYKANSPLACSVIVGLKNNTLANPWASALREFNHLSPNMLLYWAMLEYACDNGYSSFDFGRSSPDEGTYRFKEQWGAKPVPLNWHHVTLNGRSLPSESSSEKSRFEKAIRYWQKLPVSITRLIGPPIRKNIGL